MDRKPLHPLSLLPALLATPDQGRRHFESQLQQWLASRDDTGAEAPGTPVKAAGEGGPATGRPAGGVAVAAPSVPPMGGTIPEAGQ